MKILITGGASGLGLAITQQILASYPDAFIYVTYHSSEKNAAALEDSSSQVKAVKCDFTKQAEIDQLTALIAEADLDVLINNALTRLQKNYFHKTGQDEFLHAFQSDILSTLQITSAFLTRARKLKRGKIITILSAAIINVPPIGWSVYCANKAYLLAMHKSWASENAAFNITSKCVSPDFMQTPLNQEVDERIVESMTASHPLKRLLTVEEVAQTVAFLCTASAHLNGQNIVMNAAQSI